MKTKDKKLNKKTSNQSPLVSVIMPVRNGSQFMSEAIDSILNQTYSNFELLIIDDASTDNTWNILKNYQTNYPKKIKLFQNRTNLGAFASANKAFKKAKGKYIAPMDSDDISTHNRIAKQVAYLEKNKDHILVGSHATVIDSNGIKTGSKIYPATHENIYDMFSVVNPIVHPACMIRKSMLPKRDWLYHTEFGVNSDYYTLFELLNFGKFANIPEFLLSYRIHGNNSSLQNLKQKFFNITKIRYTAVKKLKYDMPLLSIPKIVLQTLVVLMIPDAILLPVYLSMRGLNKPHVKTKVAAHKGVRHEALAH